jgi:hypothetical protein
MTARLCSTHRRLRASGDHGPRERPERTPCGNARDEKKLRAKARGHGERRATCSLAGGHAVRRVCPKGAAAHDRKVRRDRNPTGRADDVYTSTFLRTLACRSRTEDLLIARRKVTVTSAVFRRDSLQGTCLRCPYFSSVSGSSLHEWLHAGATTSASADHSTPDQGRSAPPPTSTL